MSKLSNMLRMVLILNKRDLIKIQELANILEVSTKQIRRYRDELEFSGIYIESTTGKYGGYSLQNKSDALSITSSITKEEEQLIDLICKPDFGDIKYIYDAFISFFSNNNLSYLNLQKTDTLEIYCYLFLFDAKKNRKKVKIKYLYDSEKNQSIEKTIHPYITIKKYGQNYLYAYDEYHKIIIKFLIQNITKWELTGESFIRNEELYDQTYKTIEEFAGVYTNKEETLVRVKVYGVEKEVLERVLECKVKVDFVFNDYILFSFKTSSVLETKKHLMIFGSKCVVLEPKSLSDLILKDIEKMKSNYLSQTQYESHEMFVKQVEKHLHTYVKYNYGEVPYKHLISKRLPISETFLVKNRALYLKYKEAIGELHSPRNLKSSQLMCLDYFLRYKEASLKELAKRLNVHENIKSIKFEKVYPDYTHSDISIELEDKREILIECKYTESRFDVLDTIQEEHIKKYEGMKTKDGIVKYKDINRLMTNQAVTKEAFFNNYQLFRNLYNAFIDNKIGYFFAIYPEMNKNLDNQFNMFYIDLKYKYGFKYIDHVKSIYWKDLGIYDEEFSGKYLYIKDKRLNLDFDKRKNRIIDSNHVVLEVIRKDNQTPLQYPAIICDAFGRDFDILSTSIRDFKKYEDTASIKIYT